MAARNDFSKHQIAVMTPATHAFAITPHDANELSNVTRAIYVGGAGDVTAVLMDDTAAVTFKAVPAGAVLSVRVKQVKATGTTATHLVGLW
jgi:hypothetical protein